jgi:hypothetical protein
MQPDERGQSVTGPLGILARTEAKQERSAIPILQAQDAYIGSPAGRRLMQVVAELSLPWMVPGQLAVSLVWCQWSLAPTGEPPSPRGDLNIKYGSPVVMQGVR